MQYGLQSIKMQICVVLFNFKDNHILKTAHYMPNETLWQNRPLKLRKNYETCLKYKEYT